MAAFQDRFKDDYYPRDPMRRTYERESDAYRWREMPERIISPQSKLPLRYGPERNVEYMYEIDAKLTGRQARMFCFIPLGLPITQGII